MISERKILLKGMTKVSYLWVEIANQLTVTVKGCLGGANNSTWFCENRYKFSCALPLTGLRDCPRGDSQFKVLYML